MSKLALVGAGRMATAMVKGILAQGRMQPQDIGATAGDDDTAEKLAAATGIQAVRALPALLNDATTVVLACKPQQIEQLDASYAELTEGKLIISILAGVRIEKLHTTFPRARNIVRAMPNTPGQIAAGITAYAPHDNLSTVDRSFVDHLFSALGEVVIVTEPELDAVTAVSGSGPAYLFEFVAGLRDGGIEAGLAPEIAAKLALHTALGACRLLATTGEEPESLRDKVTSPGGTTLAGLEAMQAANFRQTLIDTVTAAKKRSIELAGAGEQ